MRDSFVSYQETLASILEPDILLTRQYIDTYCRRNELAAEKKLMLAVLEDAVHTYQKKAFADTAKGRLEFQEAEEWILDNDDAGFFSFESICETFDMDPEYVRRGITSWRVARQAAIGASPREDPPR